MENEESVFTGSPMSVRLESQQAEEFREYCRRNHLTQSAAIRQALDLLMRIGSIVGGRAI